MSEQKVQPVILSQLEDVLEERQRADRRKQEAAKEIAAEEDRRKESRRTVK